MRGRRRNSAFAVNHRRLGYGQIRRFSLSHRNCLRITVNRGRSVALLDHFNGSGGKPRQVDVIAAADIRPVTITNLILHPIRHTGERAGIRACRRERDAGCGFLAGNERGDCYALIPGSKLCSIRFNPDQIAARREFLVRGAGCPSAAIVAAVFVRGRRRNSAFAVNHRRLGHGQIRRFSLSHRYCLRITVNRGCSVALFDHLNGTSGKPCKVDSSAASDIRPVRSVQAALHPISYARERSGICTSRCKCCTGCSFLGLCRRRCQRDRCIGGRRSRHCDLRVAVAGHFYPANLGNAVICRVIIPVVCGINHICHSAGQSGLFCIAGIRGLGHMVACGNGHAMGSRRRSVPIHLNLFYTFRRVCQNGCAIYLRRLILFCGFYYKGSFAVCSSTIGVVIEYAFGDGVSIGRGNGCRPSVSPPSPVS